MPDERPPVCGHFACLVKGSEESGPFDQQPQPLECDLRILLPPHALPGQLGRRVLEVREKDLHSAVQCVGECFDRAVSTAVPDKWQIAARRAQTPHNGAQMGPVMVRSDEIHVADALRRQRKNPLHRIIHPDELPEVLGGKLVVLAEEAPAGTSRQEDSSAALLSDQRWLLAKMRLNRGDMEACALAAEAQLPGGAVRPASPRT